MKKTWIEFLGGKKFIVTILSMALSFVGLLEKLIPGEVWQVIVIFILGMYLTGNVAQKKLTKDLPTPPA